METMPFAGVAMPHEIEPVRADPVEAREWSIELLAEILRIAGLVALEERKRRSPPSAEDVDRVVELCRMNVRQETRLQELINMLLACLGYGSLFFLRYASRTHGVRQAQGSNWSICF